MNTMS